MADPPTPIADVGGRPTSHFPMLGWDGDQGAVSQAYKKAPFCGASTRSGWMGLRTHDLLDGKCARPVRFRSRPFAQTASFQRFPCRANVTEPERTPNLAILATEPARNPDSLVEPPDVGEEEVTVPVGSSGIGECFERALHGESEV